MLQSIDLETLHHILRQYTEDILNDCPRIICKLLNSSNEDSALQDLKTTKVLLNLYGKLYTKSSETELILPVKLIIQNIIKVLNYSDDGCDHPINNIQLEVLSILQRLYKIPCVENSSEALKELAKLYHFCVTCLCPVTAEKECKPDCLMFKLKMVQTIHDILRDNTCETSKTQFYEMSRSDNLNECKVFANLVLHGDDSVAIQLLVFLIPGYIDCFKTDRVLEVIWKEISDSVVISSINYSRVMLILCTFFDKYFDKAPVRKEFYLTLLLEDENFWWLLRSVIVKNDPLIRKQGMCLFKKTVEALNDTSKTIICCKENIIFYWDSNLKNELYKIYTEIITVFEFLDEQQVHIIKPIFEKAETLLHKVLYCEKVSLHWIPLVCHKALIHDSTEVVKWGLSRLMTISSKFFEQESRKFDQDIAEETIALLIPALNTLSLYYNDGLAVSNQVKDFFNKVLLCSGEDTAKVFFSLFIKKVCSLVWSPEALFFVIHAIPHTKCYPFWGEDEIFQIRTFALTAFKTYNKIITNGIQCELLKAISNFTDVVNVSLKNVMLLISRFSFMQSVHLGSEVWSSIVSWLCTSYSKEEAGKLLDSYKRQELGKEFNEKTLSVMCIILYYLCRSCEFESSNPVVNYLSEMLLLFKDVDKRLYCDRASYDQNLAVISHIYKANVNHPIEELIKPTLPLLENVTLYIRSQLKQISGLQDFDTCQLYLNAFENVTKVQKTFLVQSDDINSSYADVLIDLETCLESESKISSVGLYCRVRFLHLLLELYPCKVKQRFLVSYLLTDVNKPLEKEKVYSEQTKDVQTLWGRVNSEFIVTKWRILEYLISNKLITHGPDQPEAENSISDDDLIKLCVEGLNTGGYGVLCPIMSVLKTVFPALKDCSQAGGIISSVWKLMTERRKTDEFKSFIKAFVDMLFQKSFIVKGKSAEVILTEYADLIFSDSSLAVVNIFMRHIQRVDLADSSVSLFCHIMGKALIFGPVQRKDERLTAKVCSHIEDFRICPVWVTNDHYTSNEVRARAVERILTLDKDSQRDRAIAKSLVDTLIKMESEVGKNRERYFADSHVHRVKHRVMQGLLLLEPLLYGDQEKKKLLSWLFNGILNENPQPSVRYQQEWLLIRILVKEEVLRKTFYDYFAHIEKVKNRGLCSLMAILYHLNVHLPETVQTFDGISCLVSFLTHQHFEVRLYAQVLLTLYEVVCSKEFTDIYNRWLHFFMALDRGNSVMRRQNLRNFLKIQQDFFLHSFKPFEHYSLETIYTDLPNMTKIGSDECISTKMFQNCGVDPSKMSISLANTGDFTIQGEFWPWEGHRPFRKSKDEISEQILDNYQRKIIPAKRWVCGWNETSACQGLVEKEEGLVVVASLIDQIPNLGGLARTCEIFGVSEYVIGSLRYTDDKQFTGLSVTAEKWIALKEVKADNLMVYILEMKENGYTIVGAEQTLLSQPLGSVTFPKKTLLLLGNEKEGISPNLLPLLDICVEVPQIGIIRSLNVHVTGALFIWEYAKQNNFRNFSS